MPLVGLFEREKELPLDPWITDLPEAASPNRAASGPASSRHL